MSPLPIETDLPMLGIIDFWTYMLGVVAIVLRPGPQFGSGFVGGADDC
jgi:hypothetical protein